MSWDVKQNGKQYYYRCRREGDRVIKEYRGGGSRGEAAARQDARQRQQRQMEQQRVALIIARIETTRPITCDLCDAARLLFRALLTTTGWYQHHGHEWRRRQQNG